MTKSLSFCGCLLDNENGSAYDRALGYQDALCPTLGSMQSQIYDARRAKPRSSVLPSQKSSRQFPTRS